MLIIFKFILFLFGIFLLYVFFKEESKSFKANSLFNNSHQDSPVLIWWTPFTGQNTHEKYCNFGSCLITENRSYIGEAKGYFFYGSDFQIDDLPLPRKNGDWWFLLNEESPKNQPIFNHEPILSLFNLTSTFKNDSNLPLTLQHLQNQKSLTSNKYFKTTSEKNSFLLEGNSPILYLQSDCNSPSQRDTYVKEISKYIPIDSFGVCLNNKELPQHLKDRDNIQHHDLYELISQYKFTIAFENYACDDYITEKLWRPLVAGSVPIYWGSSSVQNWLPYNKSIVHVRDFSSPKMLVDYLNTLLNDNSLYESHLDHKIKRKISNKSLMKSLEERNYGVFDDQISMSNFVEAFECLACDHIIQFHNAQLGSFMADKSHYGCPLPEKMLHTSDYHDMWTNHWFQGEAEANVLYQLINSDPGFFTMDTFYEKVIEYLQHSDYSPHQEL